jgi:ubiquinone/menaquinone biosynthesis C-methylase UbiE
MAVRLKICVVGVVVWLAYVGLAAEQLASRSTAEWIKTLDAPERVAALKVDEVLARLKVSPGQVIADLGAGTGAFTVPFARAVGPSGRVYAVEIDRGLVDHIAARAAEAKLTNVKAGIGKPSDPALPEPVDLAFMNDVLHHVEDRATYLTQAATYVKPGGRFVIIDPEPASSPHRDDPTLIVSKAQAADWMKTVGFAAQEDVGLYTDKWFVIYRRK